MPWIRCYFVLFLSYLAAGSCAAALENSRLPSLTRRADPPQSTACGDVVNGRKRYFEAKLVYDCLTSVPFNPVVGKRFVQYYNESMQFQSTLELLKSPPSSYQQPAVDVVSRLNQMILDIDKGVFKNEYEFESALQAIVYAMHDDHVSLTAGVLGAFSFGVDWDYEIVSVSLDGLQLPKIYFTDDLESSAFDGDWTASAISKINDEDVIAYLTDFAAKQSVGSLEPHSGFNQLMASPAQDIQGYDSVWTAGATFYPGDTLTFVLENGTKIGPTPWYAEYHSPGPTGPLQTGTDFYNFFVLGLYPESYNPYANFTPATGTNPATPSSSAASSIRRDDTTDEETVLNSWNNLAYPDFPDIAQEDLGTFGGGSVSGYFIDELAVLSIPNFIETGLAVGTFSQTIQDFITNSTAAGMKKVVIDVQQNWGGDAFLAFDAFRQFFPNIDPYGGSRLRANSPANVMGQTITSYWQDIDDEEDEDFYKLYTSEWVSSTRLNANTNRTFSSWNESFGPSQKSGDYFTTTQRYNFSDVLFDTMSAQTNDDFVVHGYGPAVNTTPPYAAKDIIILSDSLCSSTCAIFMEAMRHEAGVKTVVAGGRPSYGPMQAPSLARGARSYGITDLLDNDIGYVQSLLRDMNDPTQNFLQNRTQSYDVFVNYAGLNLRDQIRKGSDIPIQFLYEPADCRIFFTNATWNNYTALWQYAADAIWNKPSLCVKDSTNHLPSNNTIASSASAPVVPYPTAVKPQPSSFAETIMRLGFGAPPAPESGPITACNGNCPERSDSGSRCDKNNQCIPGFFCLTTYMACNNDPINPQLVLQPTCFLECELNSQGSCLNNGVCQPFDPRKRNELTALQEDPTEDPQSIKSLMALEQQVDEINKQLNTKPLPTQKVRAGLLLQLKNASKQLKQLQGTTPGYCYPPSPPTIAVCKQQAKAATTVKGAKAAKPINVAKPIVKRTLRVI